jgi:hypothetical protein
LVEKLFLIDYSRKLSPKLRKRRNKNRRKYNDLCSFYFTEIEVTIRSKSFEDALEGDREMMLG